MRYGQIRWKTYIQIVIKKKIQVKSQLSRILGFMMTAYLRSQGEEGANKDIGEEENLVKIYCMKKMFQQ